tara:strand:+ start:511 stop:1041 length:531 start_codon:yes stop_codon:yes gene_type:complete
MKLYSKTITFVLFLGVIYAQIKLEDLIPKRRSDTYEKTEKYYNEGQTNDRFKHNQLFSASFSFYRGAPISTYSYTNIFSYDIREDLLADVKIHGRFFKGAYNNLWGNDIYNEPHIAMDAGLKYSPFNNGLIDVNARTNHHPGWSGQSVYLSILGIRIKRLYSSKSYHDYEGPFNLD